MGDGHIYVKVMFGNLQGLIGRLGQSSVVCLDNLHEVSCVLGSVSIG